MDTPESWTPDKDDPVHEINEELKGIGSPGLCRRCAAQLIAVMEELCPRCNEVCGGLARKAGIGRDPVLDPPPPVSLVAAPAYGGPAEGIGIGPTMINVKLIHNGWVVSYFTGTFIEVYASDDLPKVVSNAAAEVLKWREERKSGGFPRA